MTRHPAKYSDALLPVFYSIVKDCDTVLDPFAGTGKLVDLIGIGFNGIVFLNEIEPEWYTMCKNRADKHRFHVDANLGDACDMPYVDDAFDAIATSPSYGNRMADSHIPGEGWEAAKSQRNTYTHALGRKLDSANSGGMQWGDAYRSLHIKAWWEAKRVLKHRGLFVLNIKDHIRSGRRMEVAQWHTDILIAAGFTLTNKLKVETPGLRYGRNAETRIDYEYVLTFVNDPEYPTFTNLEDY